jgi:preprotein translocase subunit SecE
MIDGDTFDLTDGRRVRMLNVNTPEKGEFGSDQGIAYMQNFETKTELKHMTWPTKSQTISYTLVVIILSVLVAYMLGLFDFLFSRGLEKLLSI